MIKKAGIFLILLLFLAPEGGIAQSVSVDLGDGSGSFTGRLIQLFGLISVLSLAPAILVMTTSFTRIVVVFSFLKNALGLQQSPPNQVIMGLALFMTFFVMGPTLEKVYKEGVAPLVAEEITEDEAFTKISTPLHQFMTQHVRAKDVQLFTNFAKIPEVKDPKEVPLRVLIPAFMISELKRAFEIGFLIFLPFLIIDMVVASILMSMGMMMLPPVMIALPFKLIFFVLIDGWHLVAGSLIQSYATPG